VVQWSVFSCRLQQELHRGARPHPDADNAYRVYFDDPGTSQLYHCTLFPEFLHTAK
jgi:hypothetical protein